MGKSFEELKEKLDELNSLKSEAENTESEESEKELKQKVFDGAMELLSSTGEFSPNITRTDKQGIDEQLARWQRDVKWPAEALRDWAIGKRR